MAIQQQQQACQIQVAQPAPYAELLPDEHEVEGGEPDRQALCSFCTACAWCVPLSFVVMTLVFYGTTSLFNPYDPDQSPSASGGSGPGGAGSGSPGSGSPGSGSPGSGSPGSGSPGSGSPGSGSPGSGSQTGPTEVIKYTYDPNDPAWKFRRQYICFFDSSRSYYSIGSKEYSILTFPYAYCHATVYCCAGLDSNFDIQPKNPQVDLSPGNAMQHMVDFKKVHTQLVVYIMVGRGSEDHASFKALDAAGTSVLDSFVVKTNAWLDGHGFDGVVFSWENTPNDNVKSDGNMYMHVHQKLWTVYKKRVAAMYPVEAKYVNYEAAPLLKDSIIRPLIPENIFLAPPKIPAGYNNGTTFFPLPHVIPLADYKDIIDTYKFNSRVGASGYDFCLIMSFVSLSFRLQSSGPFGRPWGLPATGPGSPGVTNEPGRLTYSDVCQRKASFTPTSVTKFFTAGIGSTEYIAYMTEENLFQITKNARSLGSTGVRCIGIWDPYYDDFAGECGSTRYPYMQTLFRHPD